MHSPWGVMHWIIAETGWSWHYVLWKVSRVNIMLAMHDQSNFKNIEEQAKEETGADLAKRVKKLRGKV